MLDAGKPPLFEAKLIKHNDADIEVKNQEAADAIVAAVSQASWQVASVAQKEKRRNPRSEEHTSELQSPDHLVCRLLLEKKKKKNNNNKNIYNIEINNIPESQITLNNKQQ